jgi:DNA repair exonuclease SbcCD ATPase subunit
MILKKLKVHNFKSIYGDFEIDLEDIKGFWKIEGTVGSGKTTLGEAIIFGLFGDVKGKNNKDLISWGEKKGSVYIECFSKGHNLKINRNIRGDLDVLVDDEPLVFTNKRDAQSQLAEEYYDVSKMTLELLCIISFNNFKSLSNMTPADSRAFLDQVFGFSLLTQYAELCKIERKNSGDEVISAQYDKRNIETQIQKIKDLSNIERIEGDLSHVKKLITNLNTEKNTCNSNYQDRISVINTQLREKQDELAKIKALGSNVASEIKFIEQGKCPTCGAPIDQSQLEIKKKAREVFLEQYNVLSAQVKTINESKEKEKRLLNEELRKFNDLHNDLLSLKTKLEEQERRSSINLKEIEELEVKAKQIEDKINHLKIDEEEWGQLLEFLSTTIRQKILSSFIPLLNSSIQEYTRQLNLPYVIEFDNQFKCTIKLFGLDRNINISSLSTGQLKTIDMCIILGVLKVIFSGVNFNIMFLDELFSNMDADLRSKVCNVLKSEIKENQTIFIISHQEISDANFDGAIHAKLSYSNGVEKTNYSVKSYTI